jgi:hypothetical protein
MLKHTLLLIIAIALLAPAETLMSGKIDNISFSTQGNPYIVQKDIEVSKGSTVVIPQGCVILFNSFTGLQIFGRLIVKGTVESPVIFSSINDADRNPSATQLPNPFDWNGIFIAAESDGAFFNNFSLRFSVYGIKSQSSNVIIQNGIFQQNGQFHFTINDQIQFVQDNIPFSYGKKEDDSTKPATPGQSTGTKTASTEKPTTQVSSKTVLRIAGLSIGIIGVGLGTFFAVRAVQANHEAVDMGKLDINDFSQQKFDDAQARQKKNTIGSAISYGLGGLGLIGFGLTFAF